MTVLLVLAAVVFVALYVRRARRANLLAGRVSERPVYSIEPPQRRMRAARKDVL